MPVVLRAILGVSLRLLLLLIVVGLWLNTLRIKLHTRARRNRAERTNMKALTLALQHLPLILRAVVEVEGVIGAGKGQNKKQLILDAVIVGAKAAAESPESHVAMAGGLVDAIVGTLNASGVFAKK